MPTPREHVPTPSIARRAARGPGVHRSSATGEAGPLRGTRLATFIATELLVWAAFYGAYLVVRGLTIGSSDEAFANAAAVVDLERALGVFHEEAVQSALMPAADLFSAYYMLGFGPAIAVVLVVLAFTRPDAYRDLRTALIVSIALATVVFVLMPTAPPRLVEGPACTSDGPCSWGSTAPARCGRPG